MTNEQKNAKPAFELWFAPQNDKAPWVKVGAMWPNKNGTGFNQVLDLVPTGSNRLVALPPKEKVEMANYEAQA